MRRRLIRLTAVAVGVALIATFFSSQGVTQVEAPLLVRSDNPVNTVPDSTYVPGGTPDVPDAPDVGPPPAGSPQAIEQAAIETQVAVELQHIEARHSAIEVNPPATAIVGEVTPEAREAIEGNLGTENSGTPGSQPELDPQPQPTPTPTPTPVPTSTPSALSTLRVKPTSFVTATAATTLPGGAGCDPGSNPAYNGTVLYTAIPVPPTNTTAGTVSVSVHNTGSTGWPSGTQVSYRLYAADTSFVPGTRPSTDLPGPLAAGATATFLATIGATSPGSWYLAWDIFVPSVGWLSTRGVCSLDQIIVTNQAPSIAQVSPPSFGTVVTRTPFLTVDGSDLDAWPAPSQLRYTFTVCTNQPMTTGCLSSGSITPESWQIPSGTLNWGYTYFWKATVTDGQLSTNLPSSGSLQFTVVVPTPDEWRQVGNGLGMTSVHGLVMPYGVYVHTEREAQTETATMPLYLERTFSSGAMTTEGAFGKGWISLFDASVVSVPSSGILRVTYPDGRQENFGQLPGGGYVGRSELGVTNRVTIEANGVFAVKEVTGETSRYDADGKLLSVGRLGAGDWTMTYSGGLISRITQHPSNRSLDITWVSPPQSCSAIPQSRPYVSSVTVNGLGAAGRWSYAYSCNQLQSMTNPMGGVTQYSTGPSGLFSIVSPAGRSLPGLQGSTAWASVNGDHQERVITLSEPGSVARKIRLLRPMPGDGPEVQPISFYRSAYNEYAGVTVHYCDHRIVTNGQENCLDYYQQLKFDEVGRLRVKTQGEIGTPGIERRWLYDETNGQLMALTDENGNSVSFLYDAYGNPTGSYSFRDPWTQISSYSGFVPLAEDPSVTRLNRVWSSPRQADATTIDMFGYDPVGRLIRRTGPPTAAAPAGEVSTYTYTTGQEPAVDADGHETTGSMPAGLLRTSVTAAGTVTNSYDNRGNLTSVLEASGLRTARTFDERGQVLTESRIGSGSSTNVEYIRDPLGRVTHEIHQCVLNVVTAARSRLEIETFYDLDSLLTKQREREVSCPDGNTVSPLRETSYTYLATGQMSQVTLPGGAITRYKYSDADPTRLVQLTDPRGRIFNYTYDYFGRLNHTTVGTGASEQWIAGYSRDRAGRIYYETDALGRETLYEFTWDDLAYHATRLMPGQPGVTLWDRKFDGAGRIISETVGGTRTTATVYDGEGRITSLILDPPGLHRVQAVRRDAMGRVVGSTRSGEGQASYTLNAAGEVISSSKYLDATTSLTTSMTRDQFGNLLSITDPRGNAPGAVAGDYTSSFEYDSSGRQITATAAPVDLDAPSTAMGNGGTTAFTGLDRETVRPQSVLGYNAYGEVTDTRDALSRVTHYSYDQAGRIATEVRPTGISSTGAAITPTVSFEYSAAGDLTRRVDERGKSTWYEYDIAGNQVKVTMPSVGGQTPVSTYAYDLAGQMTSATSPTGAVTLFSYDAVGRLVAQTQRERGSTVRDFVESYAYNGAGDVISITSPAGRVTRFNHNAAGEVTEVWHPGVSTPERFIYDVAGRVIWEFDTAGVAVQHVFDLAGREVSRARVGTDGSRLTWTMSYDAANNLITATDPRGTTTTYQVDAANRRTSVTQPVTTGVSITVEAGFDLVGNRVRTRNGKGVDTWTSYNAWDQPSRIVEVATPGATQLVDRTWQYGYDASGNQVAETEPGGVKIQREFDDLNRLIREDGQHNSASDPPAASRTYGYDLDGRLTTATHPAGTLVFAWSDRNLLTSSTGPGVNTGFGYDPDGILTNQAQPGANTIFNLDGAGRPSTITTNSLSGNMSFVYSPTSGQLQTQAWWNGSQNTSYDSMGRVQNLAMRDGAASPLQSTSYTYDGNDNVIGKTAVGSQQGGGVYAYDLANRLTSWQPRDTQGNLGAIYTRGYSWDKANNLTTESAGVDVKTWHYDSRNRLTGSDVDYDGSYENLFDVVSDPRGNVTSVAYEGGPSRNLVFDALGQLVQDGGSQYTYDGLGRLAASNGITVGYAGLSRDPMFAPDSRGTGLEQSIRAPDGTALLSTGAFGSRVAVTDARGDLTSGVGVAGQAPNGTQSGKVGYEPFGGRWSGSTPPSASGGQQPSSFGFQGDWTNFAAGTVWMDARWYDTTLRSFLSRDDTVFALEGAASLNLYGYANANPLSFTDPTGRYSAPPAPAPPRPTPTTTAPDYIPQWVIDEQTPKIERLGQRLGQEFLGETAERAAVKIGGRVLTRWIPVLGWILLAYDIYTVASIVYDIYYKPHTFGPVVAPPSPQTKRAPRPIDTSLDFRQLNMKGTTGQHAEAGSSATVLAGIDAGGPCGLQGSLSSCAVATPGVTTGCAGPNATMTLCLAAEPQPGIPGAMGPAVTTTKPNTQPLTHPNGAGGNGSRNGPNTAQPMCEPDGPVDSARTTVLGSFPGYLQMGAAMGARTFDIPKTHWDAMTPDEKWTANRKFLDRTIECGDDIQLSTAADEAKPGTYFAKELEYLMSRGYRVADDGLSMVRP